MKISKLIQWGGPVAILTGMFMVFSDLSGLPIEIPYLSQHAPTGYDSVGSGVILFALMLLLVGMIGLYVRLAEAPPNPHRIQDYDLDYLDLESAEQVTTETRQPPVEEHRKAVASGAGVLVLGTGLLLLVMFRQH